MVGMVLLMEKQVRRAKHAEQPKLPAQARHTLKSAPPADILKIVYIKVGSCYCLQ